MTKKDNENKINNDIKTEENSDEKVAIVDLKTIVVLLIVVAIIIGIYVYAYINENKKENEVVLNTELSVENNNSNDFNSETAKKLVDKYLSERAIALSNPKSYLQKLGLSTNKKFDSYSKSDDESVIKTDILYEDIRNIMQQYITKDFFTKEFKGIYEASNGVTHVSNKTEPKKNYKIVRYEEKKVNNKPVLTIWYTLTENGNESDELSMDVEFSNIQGSWIISDIR